MLRRGILMTLATALFAAAGCGGGPTSTTPTENEIANAPAGPPPGAGAVPPKGAMVKNGIRPFPPGTPHRF